MDDDAFEWDDDKRERNRAKHDVDFELIHDFESDAAVTREDVRLEYSEVRYVSIGPVYGRLYVIVWTVREGRQRLISMRKANAREGGLYERAKELH